MSLPLDKGRRSWRGYARILRSLIDKPGMTAMELADRHNISADHMRGILRGMRGLRLVTESGWRKTARGALVPQWSVGDRPVPVPASARPYPPKQPRAELITLRALLAALQEAPHDVKSLAAATGIAQSQAYVFLRAMHRDLRMVFVESWRRRVRADHDGGKAAAQYRFGLNMPDAPKPEPLSAHECNRRSWARKVARREIQACTDARAAERRKVFAANNSVFNLAHRA